MLHQRAFCRDHSEQEVGKADVAVLLDGAIPRVIAVPATTRAVDHDPHRCGVQRCLRPDFDNFP